MQKKSTRKKQQFQSIRFVIGFFFGIMIFSLIAHEMTTNQNTIMQDNRDRTPLVATQYWYGTIHVDDTNWAAWLSNSSAFFYGTGTEVDPYVIHDVVIDGMGNNYGIFIDLVSSGSYFRIENCIITNCTTGDSYSNGGIYVFGSYNGIIQNNTISGCNQGISIYAGSDANMSVRNNTVYGNAWSGIFVYSVSNNTIENNTVFDNGNDGIRIGSASSKNNIIKNNVLSNNTYEVYLDYSTFSTVENNTLNGKMDSNYGILCYYGHNSTLLNNDISNFITAGMRLYETKNTSITANKISNTTGDSIEMVYGSDNSLKNNTIFTSSSNGVTISSSPNLYVGFNTIFNCSSYGVSISSSPNNYIGFNTIHNCLSYLISVADSNNQTIENCTLSDGEYGIAIFNGNNSRISNNTINNTSGFQIRVSSFNNTKVQSNLLYGNNIYTTGIVGINSWNFTAEFNHIQDFTESGIRLELYMENFTLQNNTLIDNSIGIRFDTAKNGSILYNNISYCSNYGIHGFGLLENTTISYNRITETNGAILLNNCHSNNITFNIASQNQYPVYLQNSNYNLVQNNTFKGNTNGISDLGIGNQLLNNNFYDPTIIWTADTTNPLENTVVQFTVTVSGDLPISYYWDFKDGFTSDQENPTHAFAVSGIFYVECTITDHEGEFDTYGMNINVQDAPESWLGMIHITGTNWTDWAVNYPEIVTGTGIESDPFLIKNVNVNGMGADYGIWISDSNSSTFFRIENCTISHCVQQGLYLSDAYNGEIANNTISFNYMGLALMSLGDIITNMTIKNNMIFNNTYAGIYFDRVSNNSINKNWIYNNSNSIVLSSSDLNKVTNNTIKGNFANLPSENLCMGNIFLWNNFFTPTVVWTTNVTTYIVSKSVQFNATTTGDLPISYYWIFQDGTFASVENPIHIFYSAGTYRVNLTIVDADGESSSYLQNIIVITDTTPNALFDWSIEGADAINVGKSVKFTQIYPNDGDLPLQYQWNFGDGTQNSTLQNPDHIFTAVGNYTVILTVTDNDGDVDIYTLIVNVSSNSDPTSTDWNDIINRPWFQYGSIGLLLLLLLGMISAFRSRGGKSQKGKKPKQSRGSVPEPTPGGSPEKGDIEWKF